MAHVASTALPPRWKIVAPAWAPSGLPVIATQCWPWSTGLCGRSARAAGLPSTAIARITAARRMERDNNAGRERIADLRGGANLTSARGPDPSRWRRQRRACDPVLERDRQSRPRDEGAADARGM